MKKMILSIRLTNLRNSEFIQLQEDILKLISNPSGLNVQAKYDAHVQKMAEVKALFKTELGSDITPIIEAADLRRDNAINGITFMVQAYEYHYDKTLAEAATVLRSNLNLYGAGIARLNYQAETSTLTSLTEDWNTKPKLTQAMQTLGLEDWLNELTNANTTFNELYLKRTLEIADANPEVLKAKREESYQTYYELRDRIDALNTIEPTQDLEHTIKAMNALIDQYNTLLAGRATAAPTTQTPTEPEGN